MDRSSRMISKQFPCSKKGCIFSGCDILELFIVSRFLLKRDSGMAEGLTPIEIFCCYAHEDEVWLRKLETHLSLLKRQGLISVWYDRLIAPGTDWAKTIDTHLETTSVILLLVSADFFASDYCYGVEMKRALERQEAGEARVIPLLVRPVDWTDAPFAHLQALPTDAKAISSWQNKDTALVDVAAGIRRVIVEDLPHLSASAPRAALPTIWNVPYPRNPFFLGRESELAQVRGHLRGGHSQPQAISGFGGIGKTQLALEYAYRYRRDYQMVLWARAESIEALVSSYVAVASLLQLPEREAKEQNITVQAVKTWLQTHQDWLLILDNADELALLPDFLPPSLGGHLLLTTQAAATGRLARRMEIAILQPEQGALFLLRRAGLIAPDVSLEQASTQERQLALQISQELGGLPLALDQAGAYLEETGANLADYLQVYQQHRTDLLQRRGGLVADHPASVATTMLLSFQRIEGKKPASADLLRLCAYLAPDAIAEEILVEGASQLGPVLAPVAADAFLLNQAIEILRAYSLVRCDPKGKTFSVHRLVQALLQDAQEETEKRIWAKRSILAVNAAFPPAKHDTWTQCERLLPQALTAAQVIEHNQICIEEAGRLLHETASYLQDRARYFEAEPLYQRALAILERQLGSQHPDVAFSINRLGILYYQQGKYAKAEALYRRALRIYEQRLGPQDLKVATPLHNLADIYCNLGKYAEAEPLYQRSLRIREQQLGTEHPDVVHPLRGLAILYYEQGKYTKAESLYQRALQISEQHLGSEHPDVATTLYNLAILYYGQGKYTKAEEFYRRALQVWELHLGPEHPDVAYSLGALAILYHGQGKYAQAEEFYRRALQIWEQYLGSEHPNVAHSLTGLASLYREQGKYTEAEPLYQHGLHIREQHLGPKHPDVAYSLQGLAVLFREQGKYVEAEPLLQRALRILEQQLGSEHLSVASFLNSLGNLFREQGKYVEAEPLYQRALRILEQQLSSEHPDVVHPLTGLADLYKDQEKYTEAEPLYQRALRISEQQLGPEHPNVAYPLTGLASLYREQGKYTEAEPHYQRGLHIREQAQGSEHPEVAETMHDLARLREAQGNSEEARTWYARALSVREQALGASHPKTMETRKHFIALLHAMGQHEQAAQLEKVLSEP